MIEVVILSKLEEKLQLPVFIEQPEIKPKEYVVINKLGSHKENHIGGSSFAFQSYSDTAYNTALLNEKVKEEVEYLIELDEIRSVKLDSDYPFNDITTKQHRYQAVFDIEHY